MNSFQCEYCGEIPISGDCPHGCHERKQVAWRTVGWKGYGKYFYCLSHSTKQVAGWEYLYKGDIALTEGRKCDWCGKVLR